MSMNPDMLVRDMNHMQISNYAPQQYSPSGKKLAPVVPPKPKNDVYTAVGQKSNGMYHSSSSAAQPQVPSQLPSQASVANSSVIPTKPKNDVYTTVGQKSNGMYHSSSSAAQPQVPSQLPSQASVANSSGGPIYSNINPPNDLPPPPPPPPPPQPQYNAAISSQNFPPPPPPQMSYSPPTVPKYGMHVAQEALHAPASPNSSSFETQSGYATFRPQSSASSYDASSIYEPITPRPPSQMSNRSNYSIGSGGSSLYSSYYPANRGKNAPGQPGGKEAEVDRLTDLMVQNLENSGDPDFYEEEEEEEIPVIGMCYRCGEKVLGEGSGCTAMDHVYHIACFTCHVCHKELRGKPFYAKDGKPYCEEDYLNTLEKCCVCGARILDRILRATGKPYHPNCFTCVVCGKCLDGIPFTVDATNQIYCIDDFHKKFAPRCCVCMQPIMPEPGKEETVRVVALDRSFHVHCYCCEDCGLRLSSEAENSCYPLDDHILCRSCNAKRVQALTSSIITEL